jgi:hypothetical protein
MENFHLEYKEMRGAQVFSARLYDGFFESGEPYFSADHPRTYDQAERERLGQFLGGGSYIQATTARGIDRFDPTRGRVTPIAVVTDGSWIWAAAMEYYVREYGILPEPEFVKHIAECNFVAKKPSEAECQAASEVLAAQRAEARLKQRGMGSSSN